MTLIQTITKENFKNLWMRDNIDLSDISNNFYEYYQDEELKINSSRFEAYWKVNVNPIIDNLIYEIQRWKKINDFDIKNKSERNYTSNIASTSKEDGNSNGNVRIENNGTVNSNGTNSNGYGGFTANNQLGKFQTNTDSNTTTDQSTNTNTTTNTNTNTTNNKVDETNLTSSNSISANEVRLWLDNNYETIKIKYFDKIKLSIFIEVW